MATLHVTDIYTIENWQECLKAAGHYLIDHADKIIVDGERCCAVNITIKGIERGCIPILAIEKEYNVIEMVDNRQGIHTCLKN